MGRKSKTQNFIKVAEAAEQIGVSTQTVRAAVHRGELDGVKFGGLILVSRESLDRLISQATEPAPAA